MHHGYGNLLHQFLLIGANVQQRVAVDGDPVGKDPTVVRVSHRERNSLVEPQQLRIVWVAGFDEYHHVVHCRGEFGRDQIQRFGDQLVEATGGQPVTHQDGGGGGVSTWITGGVASGAGPGLRAAGGAGSLPTCTRPFTLPVTGAKPERSGRNAPSRQSTRLLPARQLSTRSVCQNSVSPLLATTAGPPEKSFASRVHSAFRSLSCAASSG